MDRATAKQKQIIKLNNRLKTCPPKTYPHAPKETQQPNVPRSLMVNKLKQETKQMLTEQGDFVKQGERVDKSMAPRQERRRKMLDLARATLRNLRNKGVQAPPKSDVA
jgi:hypothetical protein